MQCVLNEYKNVSGGQELLDIMKEECPKDFFLSVKTYGKSWVGDGHRRNRQGGYLMII